ncbi:MAG: zinc-dependent dehydrogenase [Spirochaetales bacterium]|nr:zinc-dependent dehydrogenase [Spirochaetales bacterium]
MKVGMYYNNSDVRVEEMDKPAIGPDEVLVKAEVCGICGSDVLEWYRIKKAPIVLGHEMTGIIDEVGENVTKYKKGQRVFVSHHIPCNTCYYCLRGYHTACETLHTTNFAPGGFSQYVRIPALNVDRGIFPLPDEMSFDQGVFIEPLACVVRAQRLIDIKAGETVLIIGSGISGLLHLLLAEVMGAGRIITTDINPDRLKKAAELGAEHTILATENVPAKVREYNGGRAADKVIVCAGALPAFQQALESVDRGGTVLCFATANPGQDLAVPINDFWRNEIKLMPSYGNAPQDAMEAIELIRAGRIDVESLTSHKIPMEDISEGFQMTASGSDKDGKPSLKVIVDLN